MMKLTLEQFCNQWAPGGSCRVILSKFEMNVFDFTTQVGDISKAHFKSSFDQGGMTGSGTLWPSRQSRWGKKFGHPVMNDTGTLKNSIKGDRTKVSYGGIQSKKSRSVKSGYNISTNEISRAVKGKRGKNPNAKGYAAIHNTDPSKHSFTRNQHTSLKPEQRQFMAPNKALEDKIDQITSMIFQGIPHGT